MATITAIQNGNWSDASTWDLNRIPDVDDDVDFSNCVINNLPSAITVKTITNNMGYGKITANAQNINANIVSGQGVEVFQCNQTSRTIYISGNVSGSVLRTNNDNYVPSHVQNLNITGNVVLNNNDIVWNWVGTGNFYYNYWTLNITGNVVCNGTSKIINVDRNYGITLTINGNTILNDFSTVGVLNGGLRDLLVTFNGNLFINNEFGTVSYIASGKLNINGELEIVNFISNTRQFGTINIGYIIKYHNKQRINSLYIADIVNLTNNFKCIYMGEGEPLGYFISQEELHTRQQYPPEDEVKEGTEYAWGEKVGTYSPDYPPESVVLKDYEYGDSDDRKTGTMVQEVNVEVGCVTPEDVRKDVPLVGMGVVGSLVVPSVDDVREGVVFDNGSVGTLIVQGGGDRLRIADFGYYTNAQSDTYIVDLTEQDKPKFAVAEERVLIEMFPDLDLDNIPDKYFDDLFVKFLKYRLIVEYYRTAGINSTFTPSEPTTEIVNYQNVRNEVWLNSANIYLKAWAKKYPDCITKPQRILL